jgi:hypothetical protein
MIVFSQVPAVRAVHLQRTVLAVPFEDNPFRVFPSYSASVRPHAHRVRKRWQDIGGWAAGLIPLPLAGLGVLMHEEFHNAAILRSND